MQSPSKKSNNGGGIMKAILNINNEKKGSNY